MGKCLNQFFDAVVTWGRSQMGAELLLSIVKQVCCRT